MHKKLSLLKWVYRFSRIIIAVFLYLTIFICCMWIGDWIYPNCFEKCILWKYIIHITQRFTTLVFYILPRDEILQLWGGVFSFSGAIVSLMVAFQEMSSKKTYGINLSYLIDRILTKPLTKTVLQLLFVAFGFLSFLSLLQLDYSRIVIFTSEMFVICLVLLIVFIAVHSISIIHLILKIRMEKGIKKINETANSDVVEMFTFQFDKKENEFVSILNRITSNPTVIMYEAEHLISMIFNLINDKCDSDAMQMMLSYRCVDRIIAQKNDSGKNFTDNTLLWELVRALIELYERVEPIYIGIIGAITLSYNDSLIYQFCVDAKVEWKSMSKCILINLDRPSGCITQIFDTQDPEQVEEIENVYKALDKKTKSQIRAFVARVERYNVSK